MFTTLLESGRTRSWRPAHPAHPTMSLATHVAAAFAVVTVSVPPRAAPPAIADEHVTYVAPPFRVVTAGEHPRDGRETGGVEAIPARVARLRPPRVVPGRLPEVPGIDLVALAVPVITDVLAEALAFGPVGPTTGELLAGASDAVLAQTLTGYPAVAGSREDLLERGLIADARNPRPAYPQPLLDAHVEGAVRVTFLVDTTGRPDPRTMRVLGSTDELFTRAVRAVLPRLRFRPAHVGVNRVPVLVEQPFVFAVR